MAIRIDTEITHGFIDNTTKGDVIGEIWLEGYEEPILLNLIGNCHRDLAGCRLTFSNPGPEYNPELAHPGKQRGTVGDMTASRRVKSATVPVDEIQDLLADRKPVPYEWKNCLYIEWFSESHGRIVIETMEFTISASVPEWDMSAESESAQLDHNAYEMRRFLDGVMDRLPSTKEDENGTPLNEFQWEARLRESDRLTDAYMEAIEKYEGFPDEEELVAKAMGWAEDINDDEDATDWADEFEEMDFEIIESEEDLPVNHPIQNPSHALMSEMMKISREFDDLHPLHDATHSIMQMNAKLAGALSGYPDDFVQEPGFVVACLKRSLSDLHQTISFMDQAIASGTNDRESWAINVHKRLFSVRQEILSLMSELRKDS